MNLSCVFCQNDRFLTRMTTQSYEKWITVMKRLFYAYRELLGIIYKEAPVMVVLTFHAAILLGCVSPLSVYVNTHIFNDGLAVAEGSMSFGQYLPFLIAFFFLEAVPPVIDNIFIYGYVESRSVLILRTALRGRMLRKIKRMKYEHFENEQSLEIIDKAYHRAENSARHMFPLYVTYTLSSMVAGAGSLYYLACVRWWLLMTVLIPFLLETWWSAKHNYNIYEELETYWKQERSYTILGEMLRKRQYLRENRLTGSTDFLVHTYTERMHRRNKEYEKYYFRHLKHHFTMDHLTQFAPILNVLLLLLLFLRGEMSVGLFISLSMMMYGSIYHSLGGCMLLFSASGYHIQFFNYYDKYFALSEEEQGEIQDAPEQASIEFRDVWFRYPGTDRDILKGMSFRIEAGEKISVVGENGEGKSTIIKLLLGLFAPDRGEILINGRPLSDYSDRAIGQIFGTVFQDFVRYSITVEENVMLGDLEHGDQEAYQRAVKRAGAEEFINRLPNGKDTLLGRDFEGGVDLSGGQWQRIAMARAFMGDKPVLILDEPTSQLDPVTESRLYQEFAEMAEEKTAVFITHRLASTMITDRIYVLSGGKVAECGSHGELMERGGIYAEMFESQKKWYRQGEVCDG